MNLRISLASGFRLALGVTALAIASPALSEDDAGGESKRKKGLKRLVPTPFKKEKKSKQAVEDMREFTASLPSEEKKSEAEKPAPKPEADKPAPKPTVEKPAPKPAVGKPTPKPAVGKPKAEAKKSRGGFFRKAFTGDKESKEPKEVEKPAEAIRKEKPEAKPESKDRRKLLKLPFTGDGADKPETAATPPPVEEKEKAEKKKSPLVRLPFGGEKKKSKVAAIEQKVSAEEKIETSGGLSMPKLRLLGRGDKKATPPPAEKPAEKVIASVEAEAPKRKKRGRFKLLGDLDPEPPAATPKPSTRDLGTGDKYVVSVGGTPFYSIGPSQPLPPDEILNKGKLVTMRKAGWGWSDIELPGGQMGVVASKNLRKATPAEMGGSFASRGAGRASSRGLFKALDFNPAPEPELPSDAGGLPLGAGILPPLNPDE